MAKCTTEGEKTKVQPLSLSPISDKKTNTTNTDLTGVTKEITMTN